ncbi:MAG: cell division protein FtsQ/DivIB [Gallionellaceae bacterium]
MWDNPQLLKSTANFLFGLSVLLILIGAARYVLGLPIFPLKTVQLKVAPERVPVDLIERLVHEQIKGNFFTVDINRTRLSFEQLPWVRKVSVRRKFPWGIEVEIEEHVALAKWNDKSLVNTYGEVFGAEYKNELPVFIGQADTSDLVAKMYGELKNELLPIQQEIGQISLSPRYAWQLRLKNGMVLELGREQMLQRLTRFVGVYPYSVATLTNPVKHIDLRYRNGFAAYLPSGVGAPEKQNSANKV